MFGKSQKSHKTVFSSFFCSAEITSSWNHVLLPINLIAHLYEALFSHNKLQTLNANHSKLRTFKYWTPQNNLNLRPSKQKKSSLNFYSLILAQNSRYSCRSFNERPTDIYVQVTNQSFGLIAGKLSTKISSKLFQTKWKTARCVELADRAVKCPINGRRFESRTCLFE